MTKSNSSENPQTTETTDAPKHLLDGIRSPADIKALREQDLPQLAQEVRDELIKVLSQTGGHLGPNLGVVELTIALHRVFDTPRDRFVMDVSHQGYVHKMFTGRLDRFGTMRQFGGLNGFLLRTESEHDCYGAGHAGTALSAALGMAVGRAEEKADRMQARAKAIDSLVDVGALPSASGGDFVEAELLRITAGSEIDEELARIKSEVEWPKLAASTEEKKG